MLKLLRTNIEVHQRYLLHSILVLSSLHQVYGAIGALTNQVSDFESPYELVLALAGQFLEVSHLLKVVPYLLEAFNVRLFVQFFQQGDVCLEVFVVITNVNKGSEEIGRENNFEGLSVLLN